ncbi:hypothetical protein LTR67_001961 [Exophiala xenobiotica]
MKRLTTSQEDKHPYRWHVQQGHLSREKLFDIHNYNPLRHQRPSTKAPASQNDTQELIWRSKFVRAFPSFLPYKALLNPRGYRSADGDRIFIDFDEIGQGEPLLSAEHSHLMSSLQLAEYRRCRPDNPAAAMQDSNCHVLAVNDESNVELCCVVLYLGLTLGLTCGFLAAGAFIQPDSTPTRQLTDDSLEKLMPPMADGLPSVSNVPSLGTTTTQTTAINRAGTPPAVDTALMDSTFVFDLELQEEPDISPGDGQWDENPPKDRELEFLNNLDLFESEGPMTDDT